MAPINHVGPMLAQRDGWHYVGICRACLLGNGRWTNLKTNGWRLSWPYEQNDIGLTSFVDVSQQNCRQNASVGPTNDCYLG